MRRMFNTHTLTTKIDYFRFKIHTFAIYIYVVISKSYNMKQEREHEFVVFLEPRQLVILINMSNQWVVDQ